MLGCVYLGWVAYTSYAGGRYEGFGGAGLREANAFALQLVTGAVVAGSLFLAGSSRVRAAVVAGAPLIVNGVVTTISRSGFLAAAVAGSLFNLMAPAKYRSRVRLMSVLAIILVALLTNPVYWARISTIKELGAEVEGVETGSSRLLLIRTQWTMFEGRPLGCGHMCTTVLSPSYLEEKYLSGERAPRTIRS